MSATPLQAFSAFGIELEYMLVDKTRLDVQPIADIVLAQPAREGSPGLIDCSNELVLHVLEMKNPMPGPLAELGAAFQSQVQQLNARLASLDACLMPTGMHPWMDPTVETALWTYDEEAVYSTFNSLFDCNRHPWANVQSMHVNLPFADDEQFEKLFAAVRVLLPILPAIAASSPMADSKVTGYMDYRMHVYPDQSPTQPSIVGAVVPDIVKNRAEHESCVLAPMYAEIASLDPTHRLRFEWLNSRGAIPRFDRHAIEIRVMDTQECPQADLALAALVIDLAQLLYQGEFASLQAQQSLPTDVLSRLLAACSRDAEQTLVDDAQYLAMWGLPATHCTAQMLWQHLSDTLQAWGARHLAIWQTHLQLIQQHGPLARRILRALDGADSVRTVYASLVASLANGLAFIPPR